MLLGLVITPWVVTMAACPDALHAYHDIDPATLLKADAFALCWGVNDIRGKAIFAVVFSVPARRGHRRSIRKIS